MDLTGKQLGPYQLDRDIGRGGMSIIYHAIDTRTQQAVAIKVLLAHLVHDPVTLRRFQQEGENAKRLIHPNIVRVFEAGTSDGHHYIAMEYAARGTVASLLKERTHPMSAQEAVPTLRRVAAALDYAHHRGILHRDIKPSNVLIGGGGQILLSDFGVARHMATDQTVVTLAGYSVGTPAYMSPEQARGDYDLDQRSDIYSLGVVAYAMLTHALPFDADSQLVLLRKIIDEPPTPPEKVNATLPPGVVYSLQRVLAKFPQQRYATSGEFVDALERGITWVPTRNDWNALAQPPKTTTPRTPAAAGAYTLSTPHTGSTGRTRRRAGVVLLLLGLVTVVIAAMVLLRPGDETRSLLGIFKGGVPQATAPVDQALNPSVTVESTMILSQATLTPTVTLTATATATLAPTATLSPTLAATVAIIAAVPTATEEPATATTAPTATTPPTATPASTNSATPTADGNATATAQAELVAISVAKTLTALPTPTSKPSATFTPSPLPTATAKATVTFTAIPTVKPTLKPTVKPTETVTETPTKIPTETPTVQPTSTPVPANAAALAPDLRVTLTAIDRQLTALAPFLTPETQPTLPPSTATPPVIVPTATAPAASTPTAVTAPPAPAQPAQAGLITGFETFGRWQRGDEAYGTFVQSKTQVLEGVFAAELQFNFPAAAGNRNYVVFQPVPALRITGNPAALQLDVYGDGTGHYLNIWVTDAANHTWQFTFGQIRHVGWASLTAPLALVQPWPVGTIGGGETTALTPPLVVKALVLDGVPDSVDSSGVIYLDALRTTENDVVIIPPTAAPAATTAAPEATTAAPADAQPAPDAADAPVTDSAPPINASTLQGRIAYSVSNGQTMDVFVYNLADGSRWRSPNRRQPDFSRGGVLLVNGDGDGVNDIVRITPNGEEGVTMHPEDTFPQWSKSSQSIVYASTHQGDGKSRIYWQRDASGRFDSPPMAYSGRELFGNYPVYLDNWRIAYQGCNFWAGGSACGIYTADTSGGEPSRATDQTADIPSDSLGDRILFTSNRDGNWDVYVVNSDGNGLTRLTDQPGRDGLATAAPDFQHIAFVSDREGAWAVYVMNLDGSNQQKLFDLNGGYGGGNYDWYQERLSWGP